MEYEKEYDHVLDELIDRGYIEQSTDDEAIRALLSEGPQKFYIGFDATADSLTIGHFIQIMVMMRMQAYGHVPIALLGGGTTMVGDPTGRSDMRKVLTVEDIEHNANCFYEQFKRFLDFSSGNAILRNNAEWLLNFNFISFMREVGVHFNVGEMIKKDAFRKRMESGGLTFFEFSYMLLQSYDFLRLFQDNDCKLQLGGSDQWANILGGIDLIRKVEQEKAYGLTFKLLTNSDGVKMGKSMKGAVWLDEKKTSPYDLFQYMRNVGDKDVERFLLQLTFLPKAKCIELGSYTDQRINESKEILAYEVTKLVHGEEKAKVALETARKLFGANTDAAEMPSKTVSLEELGDEPGVLAVLTAAGLTSSNGEARRLIQQGGISIDDEKITEPTLVLDVAKLQEGIVVKKGKKVYLRVIGE